MKARGFAPGDFHKNLSIACCGSRYPGGAIRLLDHWAWMFAIAPEGPSKPLNKALCGHYGQKRHTIKAAFRDLVSETVWAIRDAIEQKDGSLLRKLADAVEDPELGHQSELWLLAKCMDFRTGKQTRFYTCRELVDAAPWKTCERRMLTICKQLGIALQKGKEGRPRKTRTSPK